MEHHAGSNKTKDIVDLLNGQTTLLYATVAMFRECLWPISEIHSNPESGTLLLVFCSITTLFTMRLSEIFRSVKETTGTRQMSKTLLLVMPGGISTEAKKARKVFSQELAEKWESITR